MHLFIATKSEFIQENKQTKPKNLSTYLQQISNSITKSNMNSKKIKLK